MKVKIYTTPWCAFCKAEKAWLDEHKIVYEPVDASENQEKAEELYKVSGGGSVPFTLITRDDGTEEKVLGFDQPKLTQILGVK